MSEPIDKNDTELDIEAVPQAVGVVVAHILLRYLDALAAVARESKDEDAITMIMDLQDEVKPQLRWYLRYGVWR